MIYSSRIQEYLRRHGYEALSPRAALIDMDGTLYDSMPSHARAWQQMMRENGVEEPLANFFLYEGRTGRSTIDLLFRKAFGRGATDEEVERLYRRKSELFAGMPEVSVMDGAPDMLGFLKEVGVERVLVTGSGQRSLIERIERDFPGMFSERLMVTSRDVSRGKPDPEPYVKAMKLAKQPPCNCIVIENAPLGVESGHAAEVFTIGVNTGPIPASALENAGADIVFPSMNDFARQLPLLIYDMVTTLNNFN